MIINQPTKRKRGGYTGTPRKPEYGDGENMIARTVTLPPSDWDFIESLPGKNRSEKIRRLIEDSRTLPLGRLPT